MEDSLKKLILEGRTSGNVLSFKDFLNESNDQDIEESVGYGEQSFFYSKNGDTSNYFFKMDDQSTSFVLSISKFSKYAQPTEAKTSYGVLTLTHLKEEQLDQAVVDDGNFELNNSAVEMDDSMSSRLLKQVSVCINDYLQKMPKVIKFYDEMQDVIKTDNYNNKMSASISDWLGGNEVWKMQIVEKDKLNIISK